MKWFFVNFWLSSLISLVITLFLVLSTVNPKIKHNEYIQQDIHQIDSILKKNSITETEIAVLREKNAKLSRSVEQTSSKGEIIGKEIILAVFYFLVIGIITQLIIDVNKNGDSIRVIKRALKEYKVLIKRHNTIREPYASFIAKKVSDVEHLGGIAFISFCEESYIEWLIESLKEAKKSYEATLTYKPKWFFEDEPIGGMSREEKQEILKKVNTDKNVKTKTRILIYRKEKFVEYFEELNEDEIKVFLELNDNCTLLYVDKEQVEGYFQRTLRKHKNAVEDDFALIDRAFVLKKDNHLGGSIIFGDINEYVEFFQLANDDDKQQYFKPINTLEKINQLIVEFKGN